MNSGFSTSVPYLQTERLLLREYRREDFGAFAAHLADPVSSAHLGPADCHAAWRIFCSQAGLLLIHGAGWWAVEEKATGRLVGTMGAFFREDCTVLGLGWNTYRACWGRGFANEAAAAALHHAFENESETEIVGKAVGVYARERGRPVV